VGNLWSRFRAGRTVVLVALLVGPTYVVADESPGLDFEISITHDDNVARGFGDGNVFSDQFATAAISKTLRFPLSSHSRFSLLVFAGGNGYVEHTGLSSGHAGLQGEFQYRPSGNFGAPTYSLSLRSTLEEYHSEVRDGYRHVASLGVRKPLTDKLQIYGALSYIVRNGKSEVFDTQETSARLTMDFAIFHRDTIYLGTEYRMGDLVATGQPSTAFLDLSNVTVQDDAFKDTVRYAYRIDGSVWLLNLGYNRALGDGHALDLSWRRAEGTPADVATASAAARRIRYTVDQFTLAWLMRF
jgi:hypothetical protein